MYRTIPEKPKAPTKPWWRPLANRWGIFGLIIFIGLVISLIDNSVRYARQSLHLFAARPLPTLSSPPIKAGTR
jgi:hypothetical protein